MHPQGLPPPICPEHANADVMFWLLRSIGGISSTTNIDSGSDKYPYIVVRSTSARPGNAGSFTSQSLAVTSKQYTSCSLLLQSCYAAAS
uniref:Uncharacterized protein n=1 Tax=Oryza rufipogon TaxID=4529 RepID=A0A0E0Q553_ORYRU